MPRLFDIADAKITVLRRSNGDLHVFEHAATGVRVSVPATRQHELIPSAIPLVALSMLRTPPNEEIRALVEQVRQLSTEQITSFEGVTDSAAMLLRLAELANRRRRLPAAFWRSRLATSDPLVRAMGERFKRRRGGVAGVLDFRSPETAEIFGGILQVDLGTAEWDVTCVPEDVVALFPSTERCLEGDPASFSRVLSLQSRRNRQDAKSTLLAHLEARGSSGEPEWLENQAYFEVSTPAATWTDGARTVLTAVACFDAVQVLIEYAESGLRDPLHIVERARAPVSLLMRPHIER